MMHRHSKFVKSPCCTLEGSLFVGVDVSQSSLAKLDGRAAAASPFCFVAALSIINVFGGCVV